MDHGLTEITVRGETLRMLPEKAIFWPQNGTLILSDLHWLKDEVFRQNGIPIPRGILEREFARLKGLTLSQGAERILIVGDLIHSPDALTPLWVETIAKLRRDIPLPIELIRGNHERKLGKLPASWQMTEYFEAKREGPFEFSHYPEKSTGDYYTLAGHLHPTWVMRAGSDRLRLDCFFWGRDFAILPAFSNFTRGVEMKKQAGDRVFVTTGDAVIEA